MCQKGIFTKTIYFIETKQSILLCWWGLEAAEGLMAVNNHHTIQHSGEFIRARDADTEFDL